MVVGIVALAVLVATVLLLVLASLSVAFFTATHCPRITALPHRDAAAFRRAIFFAVFGGLVGFPIYATVQAGNSFSEYREAHRVSPQQQPHQPVAVRRTQEV
jgi:hypothetical protein